MKEIIVTVIQYKNKILILKRNENKRFDPGKWEFISGFINNEQNLQDFAKERILFETGLETFLTKKGEDFKVNDEYGEWLIHPFLFSSESEDVKLKEDHETYKWIEPSELSQFDTVHEIKRNLIALNL